MYWEPEGKKLERLPVVAGRPTGNHHRHWMHLETNTRHEKVDPISSIIVFLVIAFLDTAMAQTRSKFNFGFDWRSAAENPIPAGRKEGERA